MDQKNFKNLIKKCRHMCGSFIRKNKHYTKMKKKKKKHSKRSVANILNFHVDIEKNHVWRKTSLNF